MRRGPTNDCARRVSFSHDADPREVSMPSPFPGMDPYFEGPSEWPSVHHELSSEIARQLAPKLRPKYLVRATRRFVSEMPEGIVITQRATYPDVGVYDTKRAHPLRESSKALTAAPLELMTIMPDEVPHVTIEIRDVAKRELVTAIEVLSPTNKRGEGYKEYLGKRARTLSSTAHLLEIDLLRVGKRVPMQQPLPDMPYFVFLSRANRRPITEIWPIRLQDPLPTVPVPLLEGDPDVMLDLQAAWTSAYDAFGYDLSVDYTRPSEVPLAGEDAKWAEEVLRAVGFVTQGE